METKEKQRLVMGADHYIVSERIWGKRSRFIDVRIEASFAVRNVSDDVIRYSGKLSKWLTQQA